MTSMQKKPSTELDSQQGSGWLDAAIEKYESDPDFVAEGLALRIMEQASELMEHNDVTRSALAQRMGVSKARISTMFNAPPNMTLRSIAGLAIAFGTTPEVSIRPRITHGHIEMKETRYSISFTTTTEFVRPGAPGTTSDELATTPADAPVARVGSA